MSVSFPENFLRFLALPKNEQVRFFRASSDRYGCELREGHVERELDLELLVLVGKESLYDGILPQDVGQSAHECLLRLYSVLHLLSECGDGVFPEISEPWDEGEDNRWESALWRHIRDLSKGVLSEFRMDISDPTESMDLQLVRRCIKA
jgi:hypothetical protein